MLAAMGRTERGAEAPVIPLRRERARAARGLLPSKLTRPRMRPRTVSRPRLLAALEELVAHPLALVVGPAGAGKSTLLGQWLDTTAREVAWLALDPGDNHPPTFMAYLLAALDQVCPGIGDEVESVLRSASRAPLPGGISDGGDADGDANSDIERDSGIDMALEDLLAERLVIPLAARTGSLVLVLDDYHVIRAAPIHAAMRWLIDNLPPCLHLLLASRTEPPLDVATLHARAQLGQLTADDLRFQAGEAIQFYHQVMDLAVDDQVIAEIEARTEGWPAGAQLAALSLRAAGALSQDMLPSGRDRLIEAYLFAEVFATQQPARQAFLLSTALVERLSVGLAAALGELEEADARAHLDALERDNLFLVRLDPVWSRYHHLFGDFLRARAAERGPDVMRALHRRASAWFAAADLRQEAVDHALAAIAVDTSAAGASASAAGEAGGDDVAWLAGLFEQWVGIMIVDNDVGTVQRWLAAVPAAVRAQRAIFDFARGWCDILVGYLKRGEALIADASARSATDGTPALARFGIEAMGKLLILAAWQRQGDHERARQEALAALAALGPEPASLRAAYHHTLGLCYLEQGDLDAALVALREAEVGFGQERDYVVICLAFQARVLRCAGRPDAAQRAARRALEAAERAGASERSSAGYARVELGWLALEAGDLDRAEAAVEDGLGRMRLLRDVAYIQHGTELLARVKQARGRLDEAIEVIDESLVIIEGTDMRPSIERMQALRDELVRSQPAASVQPKSDTASSVAPAPRLREPLTEREREVLALAAKGHSNREIARALFVSVGTVKTHMHRVLAKLEAENRTHAVHRARALGVPGIA